MCSKREVLIVALFLLPLSSCLSAQMVPQITITNAADARLEIIPLGDSRLATVAPTAAGISAQPPGSFILRNHTDMAITVVVVQWLYIEKIGNAVKRGITCDGYVASPTWQVVKAQDLSLVGPEGCISRASLGQVSRGSVNNPVPPSENIARIELTLDSVIFEDGQIWGPDKNRYYKEIWERHSAAQSVVDEIAAAKKAGEDVDRHLARIREEARVPGSRQSSWRAHYASLLQRSPNPEGTLKQLQEIQLPDFRHIGDQSQ